MKRYLYQLNLESAARTDTDVVIIGSGIAGLFTALCLNPSIHCVILNKSGIENSSSMYAQGGIAAVLNVNKVMDDTKQHLEDTLVAGAGLCDKNAVSVLVNEAQANIEHLINLGVPFDRKDGTLLMTREGGHRKSRILHCGGDATGIGITEQLYSVALKRRNITILDEYFLSDILTGENGVAGVIALDRNSNAHYFSASKVVIASGAAGHIYRNSTNPICSTGDGIAAAKRAGAELKDMEFVQFHPTALIYPNETGRFFLISEALRGEGAILRNRRGEAFMQDVHPLKDLAPRDIVARAIVYEMKKCDIPCVYLDISSRSRSFLKDRFPTIYKECMHRRIDIARYWIPVFPVQHYLMGGIKTDLNARTNISGLYACGESACTGIHGANRLASNSLMECLVFGRRCAMHISGTLGAKTETVCLDMDVKDKSDNFDFDSIKSELRTIMTQKCGILRNHADMSDAEIWVSNHLAQLERMNLKNKNEIETYNLLQVSSEVLKASIARKKSVGAHYRTDEEL
ncbi:MAG: L-aspartate oxidase [Candidatus Fimivivens sp.]|nr:L-aspartate oxidase [Candidatus Fimivivens sp.]